MTSDSRPASDPVLQVNGPAELLQAVPYLLGFHPQTSLVIVGVEAGLVAVTVRLDLPDLAVNGLLADTIAAISRGGASRLVAAVYDDTASLDDTAPLGDALSSAPGSTPWRHLPDELDALARDNGCTVGDVLFVSRGRWWSLLCESSDCCPSEGRPLDDDPFVAAEATYAGLVALPDRESLAELLRPGPAEQRVRLGPAVRAEIRSGRAAESRGEKARYERSIKRAIFARARESDRPGWLGGPQLVDDETVARFAGALRTYSVRDAVWLAVDDGRLDGRPLWREMATRLPAPYDSAPLFLFGWASWRAGNGALAGIAAERAIDSDSEYSAADLLLAALSHGIDPRRMPRLRMSRSA